MDDHRLIELETRLAYQEQTLNLLNEAVTRQSRQIDQLERLCLQLIERLRQSGDSVVHGALSDEVPPHY